MIFRRLFLIITIIIIFTLISGIPVFAQDDFVKKSIVLVPIGADDVPSYIPMIVERLLASKIDSSNAYFVFDREIFDSILKEASITLPHKIDDETALKIGKELEINHVLYGIISQKGTDYIIKTRVMDVETGVVVSEDTERASDIKGLETAVGKLTRSIVSTVLPEELVAEAVETLDEAEKAGDEAAVEESITAFEELVEENPEEALALVDEDVRTALEETVREDIVEEEIQNLFEEEKAATERAKKLKRQFWTVIGLESSIYLGNLMNTFSVNQRLDSLLYWNNYMNDISIDDTYREYKDLHSSSQAFQMMNYIFTGGSNIWLSFANKNYLDDVLTLSKEGRYVYAVSNMMQVAGYLTQTAGAHLGFYSTRKYMEYAAATDSFTEKYEIYRDAYLLKMITDYSRLSFFTLGLGGMITGALLPGEQTPMILTDKSRNYLKWGQVLLSIGNFTSGMATNFRSRAEETWVSDNSPSGTIGDSPYKYYFITGETLYYSTYALYLGSAVLTWLGLTSGSGEGAEQAEPQDNNLSFSIIPSDEGITAFASLRFK